MPISHRHPKQMQHLLRTWLLLGCLNTLAFVFIPSPNNVGHYAVWMLLALLLMYSRVGVWSILSLTNVGLVGCLLFLFVAALRSGGVNSPILVWFYPLPVLAITVQGIRRAWVWFGLCWLAVLLLFGLSLLGWVDSSVNQEPFSNWWALALVVSALLTLQFIVYIYGRASAQQVKEMEQRSAELQNTQRALEQAQSHKDEFIASVGHELRTPMSAILGLNTELQEQLKDLPEEQELAQAIRASTESLLDLINQILLLSQLEAACVVLNPQPLNLRHLCHGLQAKWGKLAAAKGLTLQIEVAHSVPEWVQLDGLRLAQALNPLLDNAIKFSAQGQVSLHCGHADGVLRIDVRDQGPGIAPDKLQTIFNRFEQADVTTNRTYGGTGIGLAIVKRLVELLHGQLHQHSELGQGAHFGFTLPVQACSQAEPSPTSQSAASPPAQTPAQTTTQKEGQP